MAILFNGINPLAAAGSAEPVWTGDIRPDQSILPTQFGVKLRLQKAGTIDKIRFKAVRPILFLRKVPLEAFDFVAKISWTDSRVQSRSSGADTPMLAYQESANQIIPQKSDLPLIADPYPYESEYLIRFLQPKENEPGLLIEAADSLGIAIYQLVEDTENSNSFLLYSVTPRMTWGGFNIIRPYCHFHYFKPSKKNWSWLATAFNLGFVKKSDVTSFGEIPEIYGVHFLQNKDLFDSDWVPDPISEDRPPGIFVPSDHLRLSESALPEDVKTFVRMRAALYRAKQLPRSPNQNRPRICTEMLSSDSKLNSDPTE